MNDKKEEVNGLGRPVGSNPEKWKEFLNKNKDIDPGSDPQAWNKKVEEFKQTPGWNK